MTWKGLYVSRPARLSLKDRQIVVDQDDGAVRAAIEDVGWVVLDGPQSTISSALIAALASAGVMVLTTDPRHTPSGVLLPFHTHHRQAAIARAQIAMSKPTKKRLWQRFVRQKIANQAGVLGRRGGDAAALAALAERVRSGDPDNIEAQAARLYWSMLFEDFRRGAGSDPRNGLLDFGYAVLRSAIARALVVRGLLPCFGLHHDSATNAFNLADDVIEPFRPTVDRAACALVDARRASGVDPSSEISREERAAMVGVLFQDVNLGATTVAVSIAIDQVADSLARVVEGAPQGVLRLPEIP